MPFTQASTGFQFLRLYLVCCCGLLQVPFTSMALISCSAQPLLAVHLKAASSLMSLLPLFPPLLHLANFLGKEGFKCRNESREDFQVSKANLRRKGRKEMTLYRVRFINTAAEELVLYSASSKTQESSYTPEKGFSSELKQHKAHRCSCSYKHAACSLRL